MIVPSFLALSLLLPLASAAFAPKGCRCLPSDACWASVPFAQLNASIGGRLIYITDPYAACVADSNSASCAQALQSSDDEFWLTSQPDGYLHTGQFGVWNMSSAQASLAVVALSEADVQAAVAFAAAWNLRVSVKSTGHDWYGRSTAPGSLLIWTHLLNTTSFLSDFSDSCGLTPVPVAVVGSGVQFRDLYAAAQEAGRLVIGGTCDSVSVAGCWLGGCYGTFSQLFGSGSSNLLSARVVLADGSLVVADACTNSDLFWSLRGGGGGLGGVVVEFTARSHAAPQWVMLGGGSFHANDDEGYQALLEQMLLYSKRVQDPALGGIYGGGGISWSAGASGGSINLWPKGYEATQEQFDALFDPLRAFVANDTSRFGGSAASSRWNASAWKPGDALPWIEVQKVPLKIGSRFLPRL